MLGFMDLIHIRIVHRDIEFLKVLFSDELSHDPTNIFDIKHACCYKNISFCLNVDEQNILDIVTMIIC